MDLDDKMIKMALSTNVRKSRLALNLTQDELSEKSNISTQLLKEIESGRMIGSVSTLIKLCIALDTTPNNILYDLFENKQNHDEDLTFKINKLSNRDKNLMEILISNMIKN